MEAGLVKNFTCRENVFGNWISINKTEPQAYLRNLHFQEIRVFGELSKSSHIFYLWYLGATLTVWWTTDTLTMNKRMYEK